MEKRCDVCHSCYDAPCQLKLTSFDGIDRGGSKTLVYDAARIKSAPPTRLSVDADSAKKWRDMGFHPVLNERNQTREANLENSVLNLMLQLKKENPMPVSDLLPETFDLRLDHHYLCTTAEEFPEYKQKYPLWGMPYALPGLTDQEMQTLVEWVAEGGKATPMPGMSEQARQIISGWEIFLNGNSIKEQLVSRYLYEHLFIGRIHFDSLPDREFYRLVRSKTPPGEPVVEINTVRPYDDPGVETFYYRFRKVESTIVVKDHTVYYMSPSKMARFRELFLQDNYTVARLPDYDYPDTANPFITFAEIPAESRYRFMLDDACYFVMGFIKGPVCRGQIALNVINDHFFVAFANPDKDKISNDSAFLYEMRDFLRLPSERKDNLRIVDVWLEYHDLQKQYLEGREKYLEKTDPANKGKGMDDIWDGEGTNKNALLTIFRHFDSASVVKGFVGKMPKTGWVVDYPLFERIHYLLVVGFNVFGNLGHQAETRIFMDYLRMEGESNFLTFLPKDSRKAIWDDWYIDPREDALNFLEDQFHGLKRDTRIAFHTNDPKKEFFEKLMQHAGPEIAGQDYLNRCPDKNCADETQNPYEQEADHHMKRLSSLKGRQVQVFPDLIFVHVVTGEPDKDLVYSVIRNKELSNNSMMFKEDRRRVIDNDTLTVVKGYVGSYPNAFTRIPIDQMGITIDSYLKIKDEIGYYHFAKKYSIQRNCPCFWEESDWHHTKALELQPIEGGLFDLYRFHRIGEKADAKVLKW
ncbi:MAG: fatty acid cis/trans isomerase [Desulfosalsimonadaceae bacterium]